MKTKELIARLQEADPTGEEQCCIQNGDIWDISVEPAYYDGSLHVIDFDEDRRPVKGRRFRSGKKINLNPIYISDALEYDNFVVEYLTEEDRKRYQPGDVEAKRHDKEISMIVEKEHFVNWVFVKIQTQRTVPLGWVDRIKKTAEDFYEAQKIGPDNPMTKVPMGKSYHDCREEYYEDTFSVVWDEYSRILIEVKVK
jgi:hypothetical protein